MMQTYSLATGETQATFPLQVQTKPRKAVCSNMDYEIYHLNLFKSTFATSFKAR